MHSEPQLRKVLKPLLATAAALLCACAHAASQQKVDEGATLHVYTNLLQLPVLVLSQKRQQLPPIEPDRFLLRIGNAPPFHPKVRLEGEDPITLAVLIDGTLDGPKLPELSESIAAMAREQLHPQDRLTLYGLDGCKLRRTLGLKPTDADTVLAAAKTLEIIPPFAHRWHGEKCASPIALWDATAWVAQSLQSEPGRRVLLVITNGADQGSKLDSEAVRGVATLSGVAIFSLAERFKVRLGGTISRSVAFGGDLTSELADVCEGSGGMVIETARNNVSGTLARFPALLRGRYIVEFSRPAGMSAGQHALWVSVGQPKDFVRSAGTSMPVADPVRADPAVQHGLVDPAYRVETGEPVTPEQGRPVQGAEAASVALPAPADVSTPLGKPAADPTDITNEVQPVAGKSARQ